MVSIISLPLLETAAASPLSGGVADGGLYEETLPVRSDDVFTAVSTFGR